MLKDVPVISSFSVNDLKAAKQFYQDTLGLKVDEDKMGLHLKLANDAQVFIYPKDDHQPATYTCLNFLVEDIDKEVTELGAKGVEFEQYDFGGGAKTDSAGIMRGLESKMGPDIAWFTDPAGNTLSVMQSDK